MLKTSGEYPNKMRIFKIHVSEGGKVSGSATTNRKATEYDKKSSRKVFNEKVQSMWFVEFANKGENAKAASKLQKDDWIEVPVNAWSITYGEEYTDKDGNKKYSPAVVTIWDWKYSEMRSENTTRAPASSGTLEEEFPF
jgi:hypothetical protein